jgi:hypothetical protein
MPCDSDLDMERRWVRSRAWGVVTNAEALAGRRKFADDSRFTSDFHQIYDGREVTRITLTASEIVALSREDMFGPRARRAFVAPRRDTYDLARMYVTYRKLHFGKEDMRVFRTMEEAEAWLSE